MKMVSSSSSSHKHVYISSSMRSFLRMSSALFFCCFVRVSFAQDGRLLGNTWRIHPNAEETVLAAQQNTTSANPLQVPATAEALESQRVTWVKQWSQKIAPFYLRKALDRLPDSYRQKMGRDVVQEDPFAKLFEARNQMFGALDFDLTNPELWLRVGELWLTSAWTDEKPFLQIEGGIAFLQKGFELYVQKAFASSCGLQASEEKLLQATVVSPASSTTTNAKHEEAEVAEKHEVKLTAKQERQKYLSDLKAIEERLSLIQEGDAEDSYGKDIGPDAGREMRKQPEHCLEPYAQEHTHRVFSTWARTKQDPAKDAAAERKLKPGSLVGDNRKKRDSAAEVVSKQVGLFADPEFVVAKARDEMGKKAVGNPHKLAWHILQSRANRVECNLYLYARLFNQGFGPVRGIRWLRGAMKVVKKRIEKGGAQSQVLSCTKVLSSKTGRGSDEIAPNNKCSADDDDPDEESSCGEKMMNSLASKVVKDSKDDDTKMWPSKPDFSVLMLPKINKASQRWTLADFFVADHMAERSFITTANKNLLQLSLLPAASQDQIEEKTEKKSKKGKKDKKSKKKKKATASASSSEEESATATSGAAGATAGNDIEQQKSSSTSSGKKMLTAGSEDQDQEPDTRTTSGVTTSLSNQMQVAQIFPTNIGIENIIDEDISEEVIDDLAREAIAKYEEIADDHNLEEIVSNKTGSSKLSRRELRQKYQKYEQDERKKFEGNEGSSSSSSSAADDSGGAKNLAELNDYFFGLQVKDPDLYRKAKVWKEMYRGKRGKALTKMVAAIERVAIEFARTGLGVDIEQVLNKKAAMFQPKEDRDTTTTGGSLGGTNRTAGVPAKSKKTDSESDSDETKVPRSPKAVKLYREKQLMRSFQEQKNTLADAKKVQPYDPFAWVQVYPKQGGRHNPHAHQDSIVSCVLYAVTDPTKTPIALMDPRGRNVMHDYERYGNAVNAYGWQGNAPFHQPYYIFPEKGDVLCFPSWLIHQVPPHENSTVTRVGFAFNLALRTRWDGWFNAAIGDWNRWKHQ
ncbi:unnamed protein product [Amoebophrya sp. A120]|nr:unnamed protein product [Amoebophrya sp. A120]|eukprot:GSA120T00010825001.1